MAGFATIEGILLKVFVYFTRRVVGGAKWGTFSCHGELYFPVNKSLKPLA